MNPSTLNPKHPGGRPTTYTPSMGVQIADAMATGLCAEAAAAKVGISARSLFNWQQEYPEFMQAIQEGRQRALLWWEERAIAMAEGQPGSAQIVSLGLRNRSRAASGWVDSHKLEHSGADGAVLQQQGVATLDLRSLTDEELGLLDRVLRAAVEREGSALNNNASAACFSHSPQNRLHVS